MYSTLLILAITIILDNCFSFYLNKNIVYVFNRKLSVEFILIIQIITVVILIFYINVLFSDFDMSYFEYLPFVFIFTLYINKPIAVYKYGIKMNKKDKKITHWGQIHSYYFKEDYKKDYSILVLRHKLGKEDKYDTSENKFEVESLFCSLKQSFNVDSAFPLRNFYISHSIMYWVVAILGGSLLFFIKNISHIKGIY